MTGSALNGACRSGGHHAGGGGGTGSYGKFSTDLGSSGIDGKFAGLRYRLLALAVDMDEDVKEEEERSDDHSKDVERNVREEAVLGL